MPINFKDYTPIPWRKGDPFEPLPANVVREPTTPLKREVEGRAELAGTARTVGSFHPHHHRLKKIFHLSHKLHLKFL
jgi:hypothetical protein